MSHRARSASALVRSAFLPALALLGVMAADGAAGQSSSAVPAAGPQIAAKSAVYDFGTVAEGSKVSHDYVVRNEGQANLNIQRVVASCGCTAANASSAAVAPGAETSIKVEFDSSGFSGPVQKAIRIYSDDPKNPITTLSLSGTVSPEVKIEPKSVNFGDVVRSKAGEAARQVSISLNESGPAEISSVRSFSKFITIEELESGARSRKVNIKLSPDIASGEFRDRLIVELKGGRQPTVNVPIFANVKGAYSIEPPVLSFGLITGSEPITRRAKLTIASPEEFKLDGVEPGHPAIQANLTPINGERAYWIDVTLNPAKVDKDLRASVKLLTSGSAAPEDLSLNVYGVLPPKSGG